MTYRWRRVAPSAARALAVIAAILYLFAFAGDGLRAFMTGDDLMNTYQYWSHPLGQVIKEALIFFPAEVPRPVGALFYRPLFALFGLNPLPYRVVCLALLLVNIGLLYLFCVRLSRSREVGVVACLLGAYHSHLGDLYYNSGTIYDLLCFTFLYLALLYYFKIRDAGLYPGLWQSVALLALYIAALGSKEMAVTLPVLLATYELLFHRPSLKGLRSALLTIPITIAFIASKITGPNRIVTNPAYHPNITFNAFMEGWKHYVGILFYFSVTFGRTRIVILWILLLFIAAVTRRRDLMFAWVVIMVGVLPVIFIGERGLYAIYMTLPAWYLFAAVILVVLRDLLIRFSQTLSSALQIDARQLVLFLAVALVLIPIHRQAKSAFSAPPAAIDPTRQLYEQLKANYPSMPREANILFLSDPFDPTDYTLTFLFRLQYRDKEIHVDRVKVLGAEPDAQAKKSYRHVFTFADGALNEVH